MAHTKGTPRPGTVSIWLGGFDSPEAADHGTLDYDEAKLEYRVEDSAPAALLPFFVPATNRRQSRSPVPTSID
jgi:hypothetical protein